MPDPDTRRRDTVFKLGTFKRTTLSNVTTLQQRVIGKQTTISRRNSLWPKAQRILNSTDPKYKTARKALAMQDLGWGFTTTKNTYREISFPISWANLNPVVPRTAVGLLKANNSDVTAVHSVWPTVTPLDDAYMVGAGTIGIARCQPSNPAANLSIALAELIRDKPRLPGKSFSKRNAKRLSTYSDEYLNYVFGIAPLINDAKDLYKAITRSEEILSQYRRDSGKHVRRSYHFPDTKDVVVTDLGTAYPQPQPLTGVEPWQVMCPLILETTTIRKIWFSGCFTYYIPGMDNVLDRVRRAQQELNRLYGIKVTPDVVYALTPYSWLADWFGSIGSMLENASNFALSNQCMHYGYVMATTTVTKKYTLRTAGKTFGNVTCDYDLVQEFETVVKQRRKASPYGFGLNPQAFTDQQWAILAALGISRGSKFLGVDQ